MYKFIISLTIVMCLASINGCVFTRAETASTAKRSLIGMSKQQILQCMGAARNIQTEGNVDVWKYYSGGDYRATGITILRKRSCEINVIFKKDYVVNIMYSGRTGGILTRGEQCAYAVSNCVR